jgi:hypothetical protein
VCDTQDNLLTENRCATRDVLDALICHLDEIGRIVRNHQHPYARLLSNDEIAEVLLSFRGSNDKAVCPLVGRVLEELVDIWGTTGMEHDDLPGVWHLVDRISDRMKERARELRDR